MDLNTLLRRAVDSGASDIHLKLDRPPMVRRDGSVAPLEGCEPLTSADLDAYLRTVTEIAPQRYDLYHESGDLDIAYTSGDLPRFRVNAFRQRGATSFALRVIPKDVPQFEQLGLPEGIRRLAEEHRGLVLVTGATGSGKTTTLAAMIDYINRNRQSHIVTIEDPIEILHPDHQSIVNQREIGLDTENFGQALRRALRQDPDTILIGELRDAETAQTALQAAESGHLVFSTLHTNDAPLAVTRLLDLGVEPFLVAATVEAILAQRLVRKVCVGCKVTYDPSDDVLAELDLKRQEVGGNRFAYGRGCAACNGTGYKSRMAIFEIMIMSETLRQMVIDNASSDALREQARREGMRTLRQSGLLAIFDGMTSVEEVLRETITE